MENFLRVCHLLSSSEEDAEDLAETAARAFYKSGARPVSSGKAAHFRLYEELWKIVAKTDPGESESVRKWVAGIFFVGRFAPPEIAAICGLAPGTVEEWLEEVRKNVAKSSLLPDATNEDVAFGLQKTGPSPAWLAGMGKIVRSMEKEPGHSFRLFSAVGLALAFSIIATILTLGWTWMNSRESDGMAFAKKIQRQFEGSHRAFPEMPTMKGGDVPDWFFLKYEMDGLEMPEAFAEAEAQVHPPTKVDGHSVAWVEYSQPRSTVVLFRATDFNLADTGKGEWENSEEDEFRISTRIRNGKGCVVIEKKAETDER